MARALMLDWNGTQLSVFPEKVDRSKLYGFIDIEALDDKGRPCVLATLADDGKTLAGPGGRAMGYLDADGQWIDKSALKPVDINGTPVTPVPSSYAAPVVVNKTVTIDEYLSHNIRGVYQLQSENDLSALKAELAKGTIYSFPYSFRGGLEADAGFLLAASDGTPFLCLGKPTAIHFVGLEQAAALTEEEGDAAEEEEESMDFGMM